MAKRLPTGRDKAGTETKADLADNGVYIYQTRAAGEFFDVVLLTHKQALCLAKRIIAELEDKQ